jgi:hypothetical protein
MLRRSGVLLALLLPVEGACGGGDTTAPPAATLVGTWNAVSIDFVKVGSPDVRVDLVGDLGASATLVLADGGTFTFALTYGGNPPGGVWGTDIAVGGTWSSTDVLTLETSPTSQWQFEATLSGNTLTLSEADTDYDFDGDGTPEAADFGMTLARA